MHSHYLVIDKRENFDGTKIEKCGVRRTGAPVLRLRTGRNRSRLRGSIMGEKLKPGVFNVLDPSDNVSHQVHCR